MSNSFSSILLFQQFKKEFAEHISKEIKQIDVANDPVSMDVVIDVHRKSDNGRARMRFHPTQVHRWSANSQTAIELDDEQRAMLILFLQ